VEDDAAAQLAPARPHDLLDVCQPERHEEEARLVDVPVVTVDDVDLSLVRVEVASQPVRDHRSAGPTAEHDDALPGHSAPPSVRTSWRSVPSTEWAEAVRLMAGR